MRNRLILVALALLVTSSCTSSDDSASETPSPSPSPTTLTIRGKILSNLTGQGLRATIRWPGGKATARRNGTFTVEDVSPRAVLTVRMAGYDTKKIRASKAGGTIELAAGPGTTIEQEVRWESQQAWAKAADLIHPDALKNYITKKEWIRDARRFAAQGLQNISVDVKRVSFITWTHVACSVDDFGPKTYRKVAAIDLVYTTAVADGGQERKRALIHLVRANGLWRLFPTAGCSYSV